MPETAGAADVKQQPTDSWRGRAERLGCLDRRTNEAGAFERWMWRVEHVESKSTASTHPPHFSLSSSLGDSDLFFLGSNW